MMEHIQSSFILRFQDTYKNERICDPFSKDSVPLQGNEGGKSFS
jgi:hypothetical protein